MFIYLFPYSRLDAFAHVEPGNRHHEEWRYEINHLYRMVSLTTWIP